VRRFVFEPGNTAAPDFLFRKMSPGDSMIYILPADSFFRNTLNRELPRFLHDGDKMKMEIRLLNIRSAADYENDKKEFLKWAEEKKVNEDTLIRAFLRNNHYPTAPLEEGFYMIPLKEGRGPLLKNGDHIWISYNGKFLDGEYFDQSLTPEEPMDFIYGTGMYLIRGLELCLSYMHVGEKSMVILPSALAFGNEGSSNGMIPPFTPVIYEIEVLKVN
jgi:FKBP-type peptidyl-prolyl cis-trans isomerase